MGARHEDLAPGRGVVARDNDNGAGTKSGDRTVPGATGVNASLRGLHHRRVRRFGFRLRVRESVVGAAGRPDDICERPRLGGRLGRHTTTRIDTYAHLSDQTPAASSRRLSSSNTPRCNCDHTAYRRRVSWNGRGLLESLLRQFARSSAANSSSGTTTIRCWGRGVLGTGLHDPALHIRSCPSHSRRRRVQGRPDFASFVVTTPAATVAVALHPGSHGLVPIDFRPVTGQLRLQRWSATHSGAAHHRPHRARLDPDTQSYIDRRTAEGKSTREANRCLKRAVASQLYRLLQVAVKAGESIKIAT